MFIQKVMNETFGTTYYFWMILTKYIAYGKYLSQNIHQQMYFFRAELFEKNKLISYLFMKSDLLN